MRAYVPEGRKYGSHGAVKCAIRRKMPESGRWLPEIYIETLRSDPTIPLGRAVILTQSSGRYQE